MLKQLLLLARNCVCSDVIAAPGYWALALMFLLLGVRADAQRQANEDLCLAQTSTMSTACIAELVAFADAYTASPYRVEPLCRTALATGFYAGVLDNPYGSMIDLLKDSPDPISARANYAYLTLLGMLETAVNAQRDSTVNRTDNSRVISDVLDLVYSVADMAQWRPQREITALSVSEVIAIIDNVDLLILRGYLPEADIVLLGPLRVEIHAIRVQLVRLRVPDKELFDKIGSALFLARTTADVARLVLWSLEVVHPYAGALEDLVLLREVAQDEAVRRAAARAEQTIADTLNSWTTTLTQKGSARLPGTLADMSGYSLLFLITAVRHEYVAPLMPAMILGYFVGPVAEPMKAAGTSQFVEREIHAAAFGRLRDNLISEPTALSANRFRQALRLTLLCEAYALAKIGDGFNGYLSNPGADILGNPFMAMVQVQQRAEAQQLGAEAERLSTNVLRAFQVLMSVSECQGFAKTL